MASNLSFALNHTLWRMSDATCEFSHKQQKSHFTRTSEFPPRPLYMNLETGAFSPRELTDGSSLIWQLECHCMGIPGTVGETDKESTHPSDLWNPDQKKLRDSTTLLFWGLCLGLQDINTISYITLHILCNHNFYCSISHLILNKTFSSHY